MIDNMLNSVRRGVERVRVRGEEAYQIGRLRLEIFNLHREQDMLFGRLGRAYHGGADLAVLEQIQVEIRRVDEEVRTREALIDELSRPVPAQPEPESAGSAVAPTPTRTVISPAVSEAVSPAPSEVNPMTDDQHIIDATDTGKVERDGSVDANDTSDDPRMVTGRYADPNSPDIPQNPVPGQEFDTQQRREVHKNALDEGEKATKNPDPLDK